MNEFSHALTALKESKEYISAVNSYSNKFKNGAGMQKPNSVGFILWVIYSQYQAANETPLSVSIAKSIAKEYGLNQESAKNAFYKWSAFNGHISARTGAYAIQNGD